METNPMNPMVLKSDYDHPVKFYPSPNRAPATQCPFLSPAGLCTPLHFDETRLLLLVLTNVAISTKQTIETKQKSIIDRNDA